MTTNKKNESRKSFQDFLKSKTFTDTIFTMIVFSIMILILSNPKRYTSGTIEGLKLFFFSVLPGLFPFMLLTKLLTEVGLVFKISSKFDKCSRFVFNTPGVSLYAFLMSILSGYPIGAKIISDLYSKNLITEQDAKRMSVFCTTSGPIFVIGAVGMSMFGSYKIGILIYLSHILSSVILGILYGWLSKNNNSNITHYSTPQIIESSSSAGIIGNAISNTINSLFVVGAYITIFYLITEIIVSLNILPVLSNTLFNITKNFGFSQDSITGFLYGLIEVTRGTKSLSVSNEAINIILASGILSFSGFSIIMQSMAFLKQAKIKTHFFVTAKSVHMILSMILCFILISFSVV